MSLVNQSFRDDFPPIREKYVLHIDSRDRDITKFPLQNEYRVRLPAEYRNISKISLLTAEFGSTHYAIDSTNNQFSVDNLTETNPTIITLKEGTYTGSSFATEIADAISTEFKNGTTVTYDADSSKLSFGHTDIVNSLVLKVLKSRDVTETNYFVSNPMWEAMGLDTLTIDQDVNVSGDPLVPFTAPLMVKIDPPRYLVMNVTFPRIFQGRMQSSGLHQQIFAKIIFDSESPIGNVYDFVSAPVVFERIMRVNFIGFRFDLPNGNLYDFHNQDHSFTMEFIMGV